MPPPPAPEGLDDSARYMVRNFYAADDLFEAGIRGYIDWFENGGGKELVGVAPSLESVETAFTVTPLSDDDVAGLPLAPEIIISPNGEGTEDDEVGPRDLDKAVGVISVEEMECDWKRAEELLVLPEQDKVFKNDWAAYQRTYLTSRKKFEDARKSGVYAPINTALTPYEDGFDFTPYESTVLFTENLPDPAFVALVGDLPAFPLALEMRHGEYEVDGFDDLVGVLAILTYAPDAYWTEGGGSGFRQSYSLELNVSFNPGTTLRMLAIWNEPEILGIDPSTPIALVTAVNKARDSSARMRELCEGRVSLDD